MFYSSLFIILGLLIDNSISIISNNTCASIPRDRRQQICHCSKQLQLKCTFTSDINRFESKDLDVSLRPIFYDDVTLSRLSDPEDFEDINLNFDLNKKRYLNNKKNLYLYFPNFNVFNSPYIRITMRRFLYIPSFAFTDENLSKSIESIVFEISEAYDFGIEQYAFYNMIVGDSLILEGAFNQITFHENSFQNSVINELIIGCYCIECERFDGRCKLQFGQKSKFRRDVSSLKKVEPYIKSLKLFGVEFDWNFDSIPGMNNLEKIEISNSKFFSKAEFEIKANTIYENLHEFVFKNNNLKSLSQLKHLKNFSKLKILNLNQNLLEKLDENLFDVSNSLLEFSLERNKISKIELGIFGENFQNLKILNLNNNRIKTIENESFKHLKSLETLDLTYNRLNYLSDETFTGLNNLKELLLSYNPFKNFDLNSFKNLNNLNRLDIISQTETDWFNFDNNDVCLLSHFKCGTQINIDHDQRCNCFVKYINLLGTGEENENDKWNKPCISNENENLNRYFEETNSHFAEIDKLYKNERDPNVLSSPILEPKIECPRDLVIKCFTNISSDLFKDSCLYKKFMLKNEPISLNFKSSQDVEKFTNKEDNHKVTDMNIYDYTTSKESADFFKDSIVKQSIQKENICGKTISDAKCFQMITVVISIVFFISILALLLSIYLF
ncbi:unnamed protein product, partial [Brachionus calyciflorus]